MGVSLLIRVCHLSTITVMFYHVLWERQGCHSSLGCVICQKSQLCFIMYCGERRVSLLIRVSFVKNHSYVLSCIVGTEMGVTPH